MKVYGAKLKSAIISAATQGISPCRLALESGISDDLNNLARKQVAELTEQQINLLAEISGFEPNFFTTTDF